MLPPQGRLTDVTLGVLIVCCSYASGSVLT